MYTEKQFEEGYVSLDGMSCRMACLAGGHVLQDMSYKRLCLTGGHLFLEDMFFTGTCLNPMHLGWIR